MAMAGVTSELEDMITCAICLHDMVNRDPRLLPCGHPFCATCLNRLGSPATSEVAFKICCPTCRHSSRIRGGKDCTSLTKYIVANKLNYVLKGINEEVNKKKKKTYICGRCQKSEDITCYCFTCQVVMCEHCQQKHNNKYSTANHVNICVTNRNVDKLICKCHDEFVESFCVECKLIMCDSCNDLKHEGHDIRPFCLKSEHPQDVVHHDDKQLERSKDVTDELNKFKSEAQSDVLNTHVEIDVLCNKMVNHIDYQRNVLKELVERPMHTIPRIEGTISDWRRNVATKLRSHDQLLTPMAEFPDLSVKGPLGPPEQVDVPVFPECIPLEFVPHIVDMTDIRIGIVRPSTKLRPLDLSRHSSDGSGDVKVENTVDPPGGVDLTKEVRSETTRTSDDAASDVVEILVTSESDDSTSGVDESMSEVDESVSEVDEAM